MHKLRTSKLRKLLKSVLHCFALIELLTSVAESEYFRAWMKEMLLERPTPTYVSKQWTSMVLCMIVVTSTNNLRVEHQVRRNVHAQRRARQRGH